MQLVKKILIGQDTFSVDYYDSEVQFSFYCSDKGIRQDITLSLKDSIPLFELIDNKKTTYEDLSKIGIDKIQNLKDENKKYDYRYMIIFSNNCQKHYLVIYNFLEYRDYYSCHLYGIIEIANETI